MNHTAAASSHPIEGGPVMAALIALVATCLFAAGLVTGIIGVAALAEHRL